MTSIATTEDVFDNRAHRRQGPKDKTRLSRWLKRVNDSKTSRGCRAWLSSIASYSDNTAKSVWGKQTKQANMIGCSERQVRNYRKEAEIAGLIITHRGKVERREDGTYRRQQTNRYQFCIGAVDRSKWRDTSSDRAATQFRYNPSLRRNPYSSYPQSQRDQNLARLPGPAEECDWCEGGFTWQKDGTVKRCDHKAGELV